jgi:hypothetical protein
VRKARLVAIEMVRGAAGSTTIGGAKNYSSPAQAGGSDDLKSYAYVRA